MFFVKKRPLVNLLKAYFTIQPGELVDFAWMAGLFVFCDSPPVTYSINYGGEKDIAKFMLESAISYDELEALVVTDHLGRSVFTFAMGGRPFFKAGEARVFECIFFLMHDEQCEALFKSLSLRFNLLYGYCRKLFDDYSPISETKIKKSLFGSSSVSIKKAEKIWLSDPREIANGAIKGIYPVNYWGPAAIDRLRNMDFYLPNLASDGFYAIKEDEQLKILKNNSRYAQYIHFNGN